MLEVGTGSGYGAAVLARLCAHVVTVERHPRARPRPARALFAELGHAQRRGCASATAPRACPTARPFDAIVVTASAAGAAARRAASTSSRPAPRWSARSSATATSAWCVMRDGARGDVAPVRFVPLVEGGA